MFHGTIIKELISHEEWSHYNQNVIQDQKDFVFVKFNGLHLKSMETLQSCVSLRICIFSNNFITDISPLRNCIKLVKLDLHGNQVKSLPDAKFWSRLKNLKLLYLHDNGFAKLKNVCMLSACPSLIALTMFDCPVSLKKEYRHVLVNSIWTLRALDHHVISDEEIIQNLHLPERFRTYNHRLFFNFCPALKKGSTFEDHINNIKYIISKINEILAHNSPVLIVQRWIRGFLVRKSLSSLFLYKKHQKKFISECETKWIYKPKRYDDKIFRDLIFKPETNITGKITRRKHNILSPDDLEKSSKQRKHISSLLYESETKDIGKKSRHVIQKGQESEDEIEDEESHASFRISVFKLPLHSSNLLKHAAVLKENEQDTFPTHSQLISTSHQKPFIKKAHTLLEKNIRREFFTTHNTGINLKAFYDIDKYHSEEKKQESHKKKEIAVAKALVAQEKVGLTVKETLYKKKWTAQKRRIEENKAIQRGLFQLWQDRFNYLEKVRERRALFLEEKEQKAEDRLLIQKLNNERTFLTKGIIKLKISHKNKVLLREKKLLVQQKLEAEKYQKDLLKHMKELRIQETHKKHREEKFVFDMIACQKACERLQDAKAKVARVKRNIFTKIPSGMTE
ncbi:leucine-rich repeat and IQ domain-containing protein 3 [Saccopteryx leptura]|uniref:leucine-rich repeat and IQ domain-containing protein 3 n=1 Tax=Saccopteryx leptura TaxID=249018 RepID=UPI00339BEE34